MPGVFLYGPSPAWWEGPGCGLFDDMRRDEDHDLAVPSARGTMPEQFPDERQLGEQRNLRDGLAQFVPDQAADDHRLAILHHHRRLRFPRVGLRDIVGAD